MRFQFAVIVGVFAFSCPAASAIPKPQIGHAELITKDAIGTSETTSRKLRTGDKIHQHEVIVTATGSEAELVREDETKLAVGPKSQVVLDSFIYDPN
jgi:hypothetical protein